MGNNGTAEFLKGKKVLVIGGTGTIGSALARLLLRYDVQTVRVFSRDEYKQFLMQMEESDPRMRFLLGDVRDYERVYRAAEGVDILFNLAALKHVPACEYNPFEAVKTNVIGTQNVIQAAIAHRAQAVVFSSSDKAVSPTNAMGATKLLAERLISSAYGSKGNVPTVFGAVRFGNVMGSRGSVIPLFQSQIRRERRITLTNPEMTRFMMSQGEAAALTLEAARRACFGEVFVLKMPVLRIGDLAQVVVEETCKKLGCGAAEVDVQNIGLRPGEKMYEELMSEEESHVAFELPDMFMIPPQTQYDHYARQAAEGGNNIPALRKAPKGSYSSTDTPPLAPEQIREMLHKNGLLAI